ncbi:hypothetical protein ACS0TY_012036 [Phlomoides rotata]
MNQDSKASCAHDECVFVPWFKRKVGTEFSTAFSIGMSSYGRALYTCKDVKRGDCLLEVPFNMQLSPENLPSAFCELISDNVDSIARVALVILHEKNKGHNSEWEPYISRLPRRQDMHTSIFWSDEELEMIRPSCAYRQTLSQKKLLERNFLGVKLVFDKFPDQFEDPTLEGFTYAYQLVLSRVWERPEGFFLVPFADFMNHTNTSGAHLSSSDEQRTVVRADRDYAKGDEVRTRYGRFSNASLLLSFGFTLADNPWDYFQIDLDIPKHDQLYSQKFHMLHDPHNPSMKDVNEFTPSFKIQQGNEIPLPLLAFARILVCNSQQELDVFREEAAQRDGSLALYPFMDKGMEMAAHHLLYSKFFQLINQHNEHLEKLEPTTPDLSGKCVVRRRLAKDLLQGELRVMESFRERLEITAGQLQFYYR